MLNDFLTKSRTPQHNASLSLKNDVINFFNKIQDEEILEPQFQLLTSIVERELREQKQSPAIFFLELLHNLEDNDIDQSLPKIEMVIEALDREHFDALSKIKG